MWNPGFRTAACTLSPERPFAGGVSAVPSPCSAAARAHSLRPGVAPEGPLLRLSLAVTRSCRGDCRGWKHWCNGRTGRVRVKERPWDRARGREPPGNKQSPRARLARHNTLCVFWKKEAPAFLASVPCFLLRSPYLYGSLPCLELTLSERGEQGSVRGQHLPRKGDYFSKLQLSPGRGFVPSAFRTVGPGRESHAACEPREPGALWVLGVVETCAVPHLGGSALMYSPATGAAASRDSGLPAIGN